jgi:hypothetical protein
MSKFETSVTVSVYPDPDYHFEISAGDMIKVEYVDHSQGASKSNERRFDISFGSLDEMEAVAQAMLKAVKNQREI